MDKHEGPPQSLGEFADILGQRADRRRQIRELLDGEDKGDRLIAHQTVGTEALRAGDAIAYQAVAQLSQHLVEGNPPGTFVEEHPDLARVPIGHLFKDRFEGAFTNLTPFPPDTSILLPEGRAESEPEVVSERPLPVAESGVVEAPPPHEPAAVSDIDLHESPIIDESPLPTQRREGLRGAAKRGADFVRDAIDRTPLARMRQEGVGVSSTEKRKEKFRQRFAINAWIANLPITTREEGEELFSINHVLVFITGGSEEENAIFLEKLVRECKNSGIMVREEGKEALGTRIQLEDVVYYFFTRYPRRFRKDLQFGLSQKKELLRSEYPRIQKLFDNQSIWMSDSAGIAFAQRKLVESLLETTTGIDVSDKAIELTVIRLWEQWKKHGGFSTEKRFPGSGRTIFISHDTMVDFLWFIHTYQNQASIVRSYQLSKGVQEDLDTMRQPDIASPESKPGGGPTGIIAAIRGTAERRSSAISRVLGRKEQEDWIDKLLKQFPNIHYEGRVLYQQDIIAQLVTNEDLGQVIETFTKSGDIHGIVIEEFGPTLWYDETDIRALLSLIDEHSPHLLHEIRGVDSGQQPESDGENGIVSRVARKVMGVRIDVADYIAGKRHGDTSTAHPSPETFEERIRHLREEYPGVDHWLNTKCQQVTHQGQILFARAGAQEVIEGYNKAERGVLIRSRGEEFENSRSVKGLTIEGKGPFTWYTRDQMLDFLSYLALKEHLSKRQLKHSVGRKKA